MVATNGKISIVAGRESPCNCLDAACSCFEIDQYLATNAQFNSISSIAVTPDSVLYIADQGNVRIRAVSSRYLINLQVIEILISFILFVYDDLIRC